LRAGDLVVALGEAPVEDVQTLQRLMVGELIDTNVMLTVARDGKLVDLQLVAEELAA
jgi:S1-C subfamily serine protease